MRLLNKTTIFSSVATIVLLLVGIGIVYFLIVNKIDAEQNEHLLMSRNNVLQLMQKNEPIRHFNTNVGERMEVFEIPKQTITDNVYRDYSIGEAGEEDESEMITYRELRYQVKHNGKWYEIQIAHSLAEGKEIGEFLAVAIFIFLIFSLIVLFLLNSYISRRIWSPFYATLSKVRNWTVKDPQPITFKNTNINEFVELNSTMLGLINKIKIDYTNLKEFTENISHETRTPLAIISAKIEMLMQEPNYSENQIRLLSETYQSVIRLKKLNETLVMLSRIENNQYTDKKSIDLSNLVYSTIANFRDFIDARNISVSIDSESIQKEVNPVLLDILLSNLVINAIKYNLEENGILEIKLTKSGFYIRNTSSNNQILDIDLFERFKRYRTTEDSIGLGLSLVKRVVDLFGWEISYDFVGGKHTFYVTWEKA